MISMGSVMEFRTRLIIKGDRPAGYIGLMASCQIGAPSTVLDRGLMMSEEVLLW